MKRATLNLLAALSFAALPFSALSLTACNKSSDEADKKAEAKTTEPAEEKKAARPKPPPVDEGIDVPTEEDFEESAANEIKDDANLQKELDQLEKEIGK